MKLYRYYFYKTLQLWNKKDIKNIDRDSADISEVVFIISFLMLMSFYDILILLELTIFNGIIGQFLNHLYKPYVLLLSLGFFFLNSYLFASKKITIPF